VFRHPVLVAIWITVIAALLISNLATFSWTSIRPRRSIRLEAIALAGLVFAALLTEPWWTLAALCVIYLALMPYSIARYAKITRQRDAGETPGSAASG
jgi:CDP-diacylglycerol---serine O-phosphatidyltransferase